MPKRQLQSAQADHELRLSPTQYAHFTEGDGLFIQGPKGNTVGFVHETNFDNSLETLALRDRMEDACARLYFLAAAVSPGNGTLELNPKAQLGLNQIICQIRELLTTAKRH
ncbi:hypothetical protein ACL7TT_17070 [Microbulbifer sp. 2304DJ12-6]|uniref:hypothetical protein n=1 Tax=Microbulbifer sp. 2304DJ12-6 TaxID=3233340 RepID=UPI0039AE9B0F